MRDLCFFVVDLSIPGLVHHIVHHTMLVKERNSAQIIFMKDKHMDYSNSNCNGIALQRVAISQY